MGCPFLVIIFGLYDYKICYNVAVLAAILQAAATSLHSSMENLLQKQMKVTVVWRYAKLPTNIYWDWVWGKGRVNLNISERSERGQFPPLQYYKYWITIYNSQSAFIYNLLRNRLSSCSPVPRLRGWMDSRAAAASRWCDLRLLSNNIYSCNNIYKYLLQIWPVPPLFRTLSTNVPWKKKVNPCILLTLFQPTVIMMMMKRLRQTCEQCLTMFGIMEEWEHQCEISYHLLNFTEFFGCDRRKGL